MKVRTRKVVLTRMILANAKAKTIRNPLRTDPTRTTGMQRHFCRFVDRQFDKLKADVLRAVGKEDWLGVGGLEQRDSIVPAGQVRNVTVGRIGSHSDRVSLYQPFVCNGEVGYFPSRGLIEVPDVRQDGPTSCGAAAAMSVGKHFGVGPDSIDGWKVALGTSEEGTHPQPIVAYLRSLDLQVEAFQHGNLSTLDGYLDKGWPVLCCVQDYGPSHSWENGHYLVVIGHKEGYVFAQDPAMDNVMVDGHSKPISELGSLHVPGRVMVPEDEFVQAWHDEDEHGRPFVRFGIAVGPRVVANANPYHDEDGRFAEGGSERDLRGNLKDKSSSEYNPTSQIEIDKAKNRLFIHLIRTHRPGDFDKELDRLKDLARDNRVSNIEGHVTGRARLRLFMSKGFVDLGNDPAGVGDRHIHHVRLILTPTANCNPNQMRGADGRCGPGIGLDIPRKDMPQIRKDDMGDFFKFCKGQAVTVTEDRAPASELKPTQGEFRQERVDALPDEALRYTVMVSKDNYVLDGTHRWVKHWQKDEQSVVPLLRVGLPVHEALDLMRKFPKAQFVENADVTATQLRDSLGRWVSSNTGRWARDYMPAKDRFEAAVHADMAEDSTIAPHIHKEVKALRDALAAAEEDHRAGWGGIRHQRIRDTMSDLHAQVELWHNYERDVASGKQEPITDNTRWAFATSSGKLAAFGRWLRTRVSNLISGRSMRNVWQKYVEAGWKKGAARAFDDTHQRQKWERHPDTVGTDLYTGGREQFLRSSFNHPESVEKVQLLASRTYTDLDGVTEAMSTKMSRTLADGLTMGQHPHEIAANLVRDVDGIGRRRAILVARHNLIYAHAEGQLDNMERLGVQEVGVAVEWAVTDDDKLCPKCAAMQGIVLKTKEAHGLIPYHVGCRCAWIPSFDPPSSPEEVEAAVDIGGTDAEPKGIFGTTKKGII